MRLVEFASAEEQLALWRLVSDNVWAALSQQAKAETEQKALKKTKAKKVPKRNGMGMQTSKFVPPPPKLPTPKPNPQLATANTVAKTSTSIQPKGDGLAVVQPKANVCVQQPSNIQQRLGGQQSAKKRLKSSDLTKQLLKY